jgi:hypothetical protein
MAHQVKQSMPIRITYGHTDTHVVMQFSQAVTNNSMTEEQTRAMINELENSLVRLAEHQGKRKKQVKQ